jgi:DTW domain-containing protein YfiP
VTTTPAELTPLLTDLHALIITALVDRIEADRDMILVSLNPDHPEKSQTLRAWLDYLHNTTLIRHQSSSQAPEVRLNLRGSAPGGQCVVVYTTFQRSTEQAQVDAIKAMIDTPAMLLDSLAAAEQSRTQCRSLPESYDLGCER